MSEPRQENRNTNQVSNTFTVPSVSLPKGGGSIRSIGEKFSANPATGAGTITVPIFASPGRSGFNPNLSITYNSGSGNGPFGLGWALSLPSITRKTDKGLPKYDDVNESDVYILSGAEDLVPVLVQDNVGAWTKKSNVSIDGFTIQYYRPRTEGLFARIERWTNSENGEIHWRSISKDNITTLYGKTTESRIADPSDINHIFEWLICEIFDDKGNAILYQYKPEDSEGIDVNELHEQNRTQQSRSANLYPERIKYGNRVPYYPYDNENDSIAIRDDWMFELVFDYGEGYYFDNIIDEDGAPIVLARHDNSAGLNNWHVRQDEFSSYRSGFEIRTSRSCKSIKMVHHFPEELHIDDYVVGSTDFIYDENPVASFLTRATHSGYLLQRNNGDGDGDSYLKKSLPPLEFEYSKAPISQSKVHEVNDDFLENIPSNIEGNGQAGYLQWLDLDGEGLNGILAQQSGAWFYKRNVSSADHGIHEVPSSNIEARFSPVEEIRSLPSLVGKASGNRYHLMDLAGDGKLDMVQFDLAKIGYSSSGFYERTTNERWDSFIEFVSDPNISWNDPNLRFIDLTGDGLADILITEDQAFTYYRSLGEKGYEYAERISQDLDEEKGPAVVFADSTQSIYLADISGDGLSDIVRIRNGEMCYWPNLGYGHFGSKITMDNSPWLDTPDQFDQQRVRLADIDGSGNTDLIYLGRDRISMVL